MGCCWRTATSRGSRAARRWPGQPAVFSPFTLIASLLPATLSFTYTGAIAFFVASPRSCSRASWDAATKPRCSPVRSRCRFSGPSGFSWTLLPLVLGATLRLVQNPDGRAIAVLFGLLEMLTQRPRWARVLSGAAISGLLAQLRDWFLERDAEEWDRQIDRDAACGKLDKVFDKSVADLETDLPLDIG